MSVPNEAVGGFIEAVGEAVNRAEFLIPAGESMPVRTPISEIRDRVGRRWSSSWTCCRA